MTTEQQIAEAREAVKKYGTRQYPTGADRAALCAAAVVLDDALTTSLSDSKRKDEEIAGLRAALSGHRHKGGSGPEPRACDCCMCMRVWVDIQEQERALIESRLKDAEANAQRIVQDWSAEKQAREAAEAALAEKTEQHKVTWALWEDVVKRNKELRGELEAAEARASEAMEAGYGQGVENAQAMAVKRITDLETALAEERTKVAQQLELIQEQGQKINALRSRAEGAEGAETALADCQLQLKNAGDCLAARDAALAEARRDMANYDAEVTRLATEREQWKAAHNERDEAATSLRGDLEVAVSLRLKAEAERDRLAGEKSSLMEKVVMAQAAVAVMCEEFKDSPKWREGLHDKIIAEQDKRTAALASPAPKEDK